MCEILRSMKAVEIVGDKAVSILSNAGEETQKELDALAEALAK